MVSQFEVSDQYNQINYNGRPVRVTLLEYGDLIKWFTNRSKRDPRLSGNRYGDPECGRSPPARGRRHPLFHFGTFRPVSNAPSAFFNILPSCLIPLYSKSMKKANLTGFVPSWKKTIGLFGGTDINGAVLVNAITGESQYYEEVPTWVDRLYSAELIMQQYDYHGQYQNGFLNSIFRAKRRHRYYQRL